MWPLDFITEKDFETHVKATIEKYGEKLDKIIALIKTEMENVFKNIEGKEEEYKEEV